MRNDLFTKVLDFSYVQIIKVPGEGFNPIINNCHPMTNNIIFLACFISTSDSVLLLV